MLFIHKYYIIILASFNSSSASKIIKRNKQNA